MIVCILTLGCKVNQYESCQIAQKYIENGCQVVQKFTPDADEYIVNTCAVTAHAEKKSRNTVSRVKRAAGTKPVTVCGCGNERTLNKSLSSHGKCGFTHPVKALQNRKRAFIKVQDGCNNFCTYCVVPYLRGQSKSRALHDITDEIQSCGKPFVLTGIDLSSYGADIGTDLGYLCKEVDRCNLPFELSSIEVGILTNEFLETLKKCKNFIPKFHIPLQSGSDKILKDMNRKYTRAEYMQAIKKIRTYFPDAIISTDVINGYPTETEFDIAKTQEVIKTCNFSHVHMFPYSDRSELINFLKSQDMV